MMVRLVYAQFHKIQTDYTNTGLRSTIKKALQQLKNPSVWISVDFLRVGYSENAEENPVVILITVEENTASKNEGGKVIKTLEEACIETGLEDISVEIKEGRRVPDRSGWDRPAPIPLQHGVPQVGSAIALATDDASVRTLSSYVAIDGKPYGLTCHHVFFQGRSKAFPDSGEIRSSLLLDQPPKSELRRAQEELEEEIEDLTKGVENLRASDSMGEIAQRESMKAWIGILKPRLENFKEIENKGIIGRVYKTSGARLYQKGRMDWALIEFNHQSEKNCSGV